jgi:hypothetical protein
MSGLWLELPNQIIAHIEVLSHPNDSNLHHHFKSWFSQYLRGTSHLINTQTDINGVSIDFVSLELQAADASNHLYQVQCFFILATGSDTMPSDPDWKIMASILFPFRLCDLIDFLLSHNLQM